MSSALPLSVTLLVLGSAVAHATWNAIAHDIADKLAAFTLLGIGGAACALVLVAISPMPAPSSWPYLGGSVLVHVLYMVMLMAAYQLGDFGQVYPLARGTSPLVVTVLAAVFVGERLSAPHLAGVLVVTSGLAALVLLGERPGREARPALLAAVGTGLAIASYTTIDGVGVRLSGSAAGYTGWLMLLESLAIPCYALTRGGLGLAKRLRPQLWRGLAGGALSLLAYGLVLRAQTMGALAPIAALRESSIIIGAVIGALFFHERFGRSRVVGTVVVVVGIVLISTG